MDKRASALLNDKTRNEIKDHLKFIQANNFQMLLDLAVYAEVLGAIMVGCGTSAAGQAGYDCISYDQIRWQFKKRGRNKGGWNPVDGVKEKDFDIIRVFLENADGTDFEFYVDITNETYFKYAKWRDGKQQMWSMNITKRFLKQENLELKPVPAL